MKIKIISLPFLFANILVFGLFLTTTKTSSAQTLIDTGACSAIGNTINSAPAVNPNTLRERARENFGQRVENVRENQERRSVIVEQRQLLGSTTNPFKNPLRTSSTSPMLTRERPDYGKSLAFRLFQEKKNNTVKQFNVALENLKSLRNRINTRIEKEAKNGKDMSKVIEALKIADSKILLAKQSVETLSSYIPATTTNLIRNNSTSTKDKSALVNLDPVRRLIEDARNKIKDAHQALIVTTTELAETIGNKNENNLPKRIPLPPRAPLPTPTMSTSSNITN